MEKNKKKLANASLWIFVIGLLILAVYYSFKTTGDTATMVAGLWSALATVVLGLIALNQSRQYKKLSDKATKDYQELQVDIKNLTMNMADAISTLQRIEKAKYYPNLEEFPYRIFGMSKDSYNKIIDDPDYTVQLNYLNVNQEDYQKDFDDIIGDYNIFAFCLKNIGEKTIRNFNCDKISFPGITDGYFSIFNNSCDIKPGQLVLIFLINIPEFMSLDGITVEMKFKMENLIAESYKCQTDITFYNYCNTPNVNVEFENPKERLF